MLSSSNGELMAISAAWVARPVAPCGTDAEQRRAGTAQNGVDIVEVDMNAGGDQIGDALHTCQECGVGGLEGVDDADRAVGQLKQSIVGNHDQRIDLCADFDAQSRERKPHAEVLEANGRVTTAMVKAPCWCAARATIGLALLLGAATAACHEHHVGALERLLDIGLMILGGLGLGARVGSCAEATAVLESIVQRDLGIVRVGTQQILHRY